MMSAAMAMLAAAAVFMMVATALAVGVVMVIAVDIGVVVQRAVHISQNSLICAAGYAALKQDARVHQGILSSADNTATD